MKTLVFLAGMLIATTASEAQTVDLFHNDPIGYFKGKGSTGWIGSGMFFQANYTDTLFFSADSTGKGLKIRRVLVNADKGAAISRGTGQILLVPGDSVYAVRWSEKSYPPVNGVMRWLEGQWVVSFDGEWKEWTIRIRQDQPSALQAAVARMIPGFGPVELSSMTYRAIAK